MLFTFHNGFVYKRFDLQEWKDFSENSGWENGWFTSRSRYRESKIRYDFGWEKSQPKRCNTSPKPNSNNSNKGRATSKFWFGYLQLIGQQFLGSGFVVSLCVFQWCCELAPEIILACKAKLCVVPSRRVILPLHINRAFVLPLFPRITLKYEVRDLQWLSKYIAS